MLCALLLGPASGAVASDKSIKKVVKSYNARILIAEGHTVAAIGEYKLTGNPVPVESAIGASVEVLSSLKHKVAAQSASSHRVKSGKSKLVKGLALVIVAYEHLKKAFAERAASPEAAKAQAESAVVAVKKGRTQLAEA